MDPVSVNTPRKAVGFVVVFIGRHHLGAHCIMGTPYLPTASGWEASGHSFLVFPVMSEEVRFNDSFIKVFTDSRKYGELGLIRCTQLVKAGLP